MALIWIWQLEHERGNPVGASETLAKARQLTSDADTVALIDTLSGTMSSNEYAASCKTDIERAAADYYIGAILAATGLEEQAQAAFRRCLDAGFKDYTEYDLAMIHTK
jgi:hypothetical protein